LLLLVAAVIATCSGGEWKRASAAESGTSPHRARILAASGLDEPLVATKPTTEEEDAAASRALHEFAAFVPWNDAAHDDTREGMAPFEAFVNAYPHSGWTASAYADLGLAYYRGGYFSRAFAAFAHAWREGKDTTDRRAKAVVDRAVGELAKMNARVGNAAEAESLLAEMAGRPASAAATETLTAAREGAWTERHRPEIAFLCGPKALGNVLTALGAPQKALDVVEAARSGEHGFTLAEVGDLATKAGLAHRLIFRAPGQPIPVPSVINWKVHHYAAITSGDGGRFHVQDPTFDTGTAFALTSQAIDEEGTGFFLVPDSVAQDSGWRTATPEEARAVYGMGSTATSAAGKVAPWDKKVGGCPGGGQCPASSPQQSFPPPQSSPADTGAASACGGGMCVPSAHTMEVSLNLNDTPVGYAPQVGPAVFDRITYNQRDEDQPAVFTYFNVSSKWTLNFLSYVQDDLTSGVGAGVTRYLAGGGFIAYAGYNGSTGSFVKEEQTGQTLTRNPPTGALNNYTVTAVDGSQLVYAQVDGATSGVRRVFLTKIVDAQGNALTLDYESIGTWNADAGVSGGDGGDAGDDGSVGAGDAGSGELCPSSGCLRLTSVTDAVGGATTFAYGLAASPLLITAITDPFGRSASFAYDANERLSASTDVLGITSTYAYDDSPQGDSSFITTLKTPYGTSTFNEFYSGSSACTGANRCLEMTDPLGSTERVEYRDGAPGIAYSDAVIPTATGFGTWNAYLNYRSSYYWDKSVYPTYGTGTGKDYTKAVHYHFLHTADGSQTAWTLESVQSPLESRIWSLHDGEPPTGSGPALEATLDAVTAVARLLDDGSTQISTATVNSLGLPTQTVDPQLRTTLFSYASNGQDLTQVQQKTSTGFVTLGSATYSAQHEPLTATDASGQTTRYAYNPAGQLLTVTDPLGDVQTMVYDASSRLSKVLDAKNIAVLTLTYDSANRMATRTDSVGYTTSYSYDVFDRVTQISYPDKTTEKYVYTNLDLTQVTDRLGQTTAYAYDADRQLTSVTDPLGQVTKYAYYADGVRKSLTDPNGNVTSWDVDIEHRPTAKHYADGTTETYAYEATTSRLKSKTDALGQVTVFAYNPDDSLASVRYSGTAATTATAPVSFAYDSVFPRPVSMTDGIGTTSYVYYPIAAAPAAQDAGVDGGLAAPAASPTTGAGRLEAVLSPVAGSLGAVDTITYSYDALGRVVDRGVNGVSQSVTFDPLGRPASMSNALDAFTYTYADETPRVTGVTSTHGPRLTLGYYDPSSAPGQNELLQQMTYAIPGGGQTLSQFSYTYDADSDVKTYIEAHLPRPAAGDAGAPTDSGGATGTNGLRRLKGRGIGGSLAASTWTRTRLGSGSTGALILSGGVLLGAFAWLRASKRRLASALTPIALGLVFAACGGGDDNGAKKGPGGEEGGADGGDNGLETQVTDYQYDAANRLISATLGANALPPVPSATPQYAYAYDAASNPKSIAANGPAQSVAYTSTNAIQGGTYDGNGSPTSLDGASYTWDAANRLISATVNGVESDFTYDGESHLVRIVERQGARTIADKAYAWSGSARVLEHDNTQAGSPVSKQYFAEGFLLASGGGYYYVADRLGSVRQLADTSGALVAQYQYDPYGNQVIGFGSEIHNDFGYAGYFQDAATGLDLTVYRAYAPQQARWVKRDPIGEAGGANVYGYAASNPVRNIDPSGLTIAYANHPVATIDGVTFSHSFLIITPDNQALYATNPLFTHVDSSGRHYATLGAGPDLLLDLVAAANRPRDVDLSTAQNIQSLKLPCQYENEDQAIAALLKRQDAFTENGAYSYSFFPAPGDDSYNSNGYISGLLGAAGFAIPAPHAVTPGYTNPVPDADFF
jgi:RHS repeat-associated protein